MNANGDTQIEMMADIMIKFEKELSKYKPKIVLVPGDVNSSTACALVASRNNIPIGHRKWVKEFRQKNARGN